MAAMTRANLILSIKREARIISTNDLDTMVGEILDDVVADTFYKNRCYELRVIGTGTAMANATATINLPADFQHADDVRFSSDSGVTMTPLSPKNDFTCTKITGFPQFWQIVGVTLYVFPYSLVTTSHKIYLDYFKVPTFTADADVFPVFRLQAAVKKECVSRILDYHKEGEQAERMLASSRMSLDRGKDANLEGRIRGPVDTREPTPTVPADVK